jgi:hypothetical protein
MDSSESPTYGEQEGSAYNGHFGCTCYHPLFVFNQLGDVERCALRPGNVQSAEGWRAGLEPVIARYRGTVKRLYFRCDAAFANPDMCEFLEAERAGYTIRLPANSVLQNRIGYLLKRPVGRPPQEVRRYYASFSYQALSWKKPRRVVAKVEWHPGELYPRVGFIMTNLARPAERVVAFYNQRGTAEQWIKEGKGAIKWTRLSCRSFAPNAVRLQLHALAYNLGNFMRTLAIPTTAEPWSLTSLREKLIKIGAKVVSHGRYVTFQMAEVAASRQMFQETDAHRPVAGAAHSTMRGLWGRKAWTTVGEVRLDEANDQVPAPQGKVTHGFHCRGQPSRRTLLPPRPKDGQNRATTLGIWGMSDKPDFAAGVLGAPRIDPAAAKTAYARDARPLGVDHPFGVAGACARYAANAAGSARGA